MDPLNQRQLFAGSSTIDYLKRKADELCRQIDQCDLESLDPGMIGRMRLVAFPSEIELGDPRQDVVEEDGGLAVKVRVQVLGDKNLLFTSPSSRTSVYPNGSFDYWGDTDMVFTRPPEPDPDPAAVKGWKERELELLHKWVGWINADVRGFQSQLTQRIDKVVEDRRALLERKEHLKKALED